MAPNEVARETPYIQHNIAATRKAFGLDRIEERELSGEQGLSGGDIQNNQRTIQNIRLWDQQPLLDTFGQIQEIRTYYDFQSVDNDRYRIRWRDATSHALAAGVGRCEPSESQLDQRTTDLYARLRP